MTLMSDKAANREYELKFKARSGDLKKFMKVTSACPGEKSSWLLTQLSSQYFDTGDGRLARRGVSVRVRRSDGEAKQTVKMSRTSRRGPLDRNEWEQVTTHSAPDLALLPAKARRAIGAVIDGELVPVIKVDVTRRSMTIRRDTMPGPALVVDVAIDRGIVAAGGKSAHFAECELELVQGDLVPFFQLASEIHSACPLPLSNVTKAERGFRLMNSAPAPVRSAPKFDVKRSQCIHQVLGEIFSTCIGNILDNEEACRAGKDPEGVHQMRVSIRRLRSSLKIFGHVMEPSRLAWMAEDLKWLSGCLGPPRDWDVYVEETLGSIDGSGIDRAAIANLRKGARRQRRAAYDRLRGILGSERYARLIFRLAAFAAMEGWLARPLDPKDPLLRPLKKTAATILRRPYRKLLKAARNLPEQDMAARHQVRIRLKKLRYALDFLQGVYASAEAKTFTRTLRQLQDEFGHINDVAQAARLTDELTHSEDGAPAKKAATFAAGQVRGWYARTVQEADARLIAHWDAFAATRPFWEAKASPSGSHGGT